MAVSSYRFISIYILISLIVIIINGMIFISEINQEDMNSLNKFFEVGENYQKEFEGGDSLVKSDNAIMSTTWGNEMKLGGNFVSIFLRGVLPTGFILNSNATTTEKNFNLVIILFRSIIGIFTGMEVYFIIINKKHT